MRVVEAKDLVLTLIQADLLQAPSGPVVDTRSPDGDEGKFLIDSRPARAIHHFSGWYVPINLSWFAGSYEQPSINGSPFYWYVFAIPRRRRYAGDHYFVCDYLLMREWVLDFTAPLGRTHRDHPNWRADLRLYPDVPERLGYFRWGDEPPGFDERTNRVFALDNIHTIREAVNPAQHVGAFGVGGESAAHRLLKLYVASHQLDFGFTAAARPYVEYSFPTGDRVDLLFENHRPDRTVIEVEVEGESNVCVGIQQAIKYRSLAAVEAGYPLLTARVGSIVVAYDTNYVRANDLAERYEVSLVSVDRGLVLPLAV